jgi:hypothetical protein
MHLDSYAGCFLIVLVSILLAIAGQLAMRKMVHHERLTKSHEVGGSIYQVVGTLYAVLLGLVVVDSMQKFQIARDVTEHEANSLASVFMLTDRLPDPKKTQIQKMCVDYSNLVINTEWHQMNEGSYSPDARRLAVNINKAVMSFEPTTENEKAVYQQLIQDANDFWQARRSRINMALNGTPAVEWVTLVAGGIITVFFTYFFGLENVKLQMIMTSMVSMLISLNLVLVLLFASPFSGDLCVSTESFKIDQGIFENRVTSLNQSH